MNFTIARLVSLLPIVEFVWINDPLDAPDNDFTNSKLEVEENAYGGWNLTADLYDSSNFKRALPVPTNLVVQDPSPDHLKVISQSPADAQNFFDSPNFLRKYIYDPSQRDQSTLYILDKGFRLDHQVGGIPFDLA